MGWIQNRGVSSLKTREVGRACFVLYCCIIKQCDRIIEDQPNKISRTGTSSRAGLFDAVVGNTQETVGGMINVQ